jgi:hypothetical protein
VPKGKNLSTPRNLDLKIPAETDDYLILLASLGKLGFTRNDVAVEILVRETHRLDNEKYHGRKVRKPRKPELPDEKTKKDQAE